jgi:hypothetical protein
MATTSFTACPTDIVEAPVDVVWKLLTNISGWGSFFDLRVTSVEPPGPAATTGGSCRLPAQSDMCTKLSILGFAWWCVAETLLKETRLFMA